MSFKKMEARDKISRACYGEIIDVEEVHESSSGLFLTTKVTVNGLETSPNVNVWLTFRPEWFTEKWHAEGGPETFKQHEEETYEKDGVEKKVSFSLQVVYSSNIASQEDKAQKCSLLAAIFPTEELLTEFFNKAVALDINPEEPDLEAITKLFREEFVGKKIGFTQKQKRIKTDMVDSETGKAVYIKDDKYEVGHYYQIGESAAKYYAKEAKNGRYKVTFDTDTF
jgi:hypothetical protein